MNERNTRRIFWLAILILVLGTLKLTGHLG
jgi:hypothetical protein